MVYVFLADGFEEIEFIAPVDIMRRAEIEVCTVGIGKKTVTSSHGIRIESDLIDSELTNEDFDMIVLPGGMPGASNLDKSETVDRYIHMAIEKGKFIAAICAAPFVIGKRDVLSGKNAVCFPGYESELKGANVLDKPVVKDGKIITAKGPGVSLEFGFELVRCLKDLETSKNIRKSMQCIDLI